MRFFHTAFLLTFIFISSARAEINSDSNANQKPSTSESISAIKDNQGRMVIQDKDQSVIIDPHAFDSQFLDHKTPIFGTPILEKNTHAVGWLVFEEHCCTSYPVPTTLAVYYNKNLIQLGDGMMIWSWAFWKSGKNIALQTGPVHGDMCYYHLYEIETKKIIAEMDCTEHALPDWVLVLNEKKNPE